MSVRSGEAMNQCPPSVSAVIPAYNAGDTIERALNSVYAQTYENTIEVIVVDDGSTDETAQIVRDRFPDVILIQQRNAGAAAARNSGVSAASGEWIAFLDADDEWLPEETVDCSKPTNRVRGARGSQATAPWPGSICATPLISLREARSRSCATALRNGSQVCIGRCRGARPLTWTGG